MSFYFKNMIKPRIAPRLHNIVTPKPVPRCEDCKYHFQGGCKLFKHSYLTVEDTVFQHYVDTIACRALYDLCGPDGKYFKPK